MANKHRVSFIAEKKVVQSVAVDFKTRAGKEVSFEGHKKVKEPVCISFLARNKN